MEMNYKLKSENGYLLANFYGNFDVYNSIELIDGVIKECRKTNVNKLFIDIRGTKMDIPVHDLYIAGKYAKIFEENKLKVVICLRKEQRHPERIFENVARSYGVVLKIGENGDELLAWLMDDKE